MTARSTLRLALVLAAGALVPATATALAADPGDPAAGATTTPTATTPTTPTTPTGETPDPAPKPPAAKRGRVTSLDVDGVATIGKERVTLAGRSFRIRAIVRPYVPNQTFRLRVYVGGKRIGSKRLKLGKRRGKPGGVIVTHIKARRTGRLAVVLVHTATKRLRTVKSRTLHVRALRSSLGFGASGPAVRLLQQRLAALGYAVPQSGVFDSGTGRAVLAYRKVNSMPRTMTPNRRIMARLLDRKGAFVPKYPGHGRHVEADISRQVLALIDPGGKVFRTYHISSGAPGTPTVLGSFRFYMKDFGTNQKGMVHSSYFIRGYAIHGYYTVPPYNASHGCLRVPIPNALSIFNWVRIGEQIDVYR